MGSGWRRSIPWHLHGEIPRKSALEIRRETLFSFRPEVPAILSLSHYDDLRFATDSALAPFCPTNSHKPQRAFNLRLSIALLQDGDVHRAVQGLEAGSGLVVFSPSDAVGRQEVRRGRACRLPFARPAV